ncbi:MAG TPA: glycosyltransferase [Thermoleophilaceae bacterium]|nr:glycosyltransferase [Thermoleophilaceae bacterium]
MSGTVLFVSYTGDAWGSDRLLGDFATGLAPPVAVACPDGPLAERLRAAGVEHVPVARRPLDMRASARDRAATPLRIAGLAREARRAARRLRPAVVVGWNSRGLLAAAPAARGSRLVLHQNEMPRGLFVRRAVHAVARRCDLAVALSQTIAADLSVPASVVRGGVDLARYTAEWPRPGPPTALFLAALVPWKRPDLALEAVALAARDVPDLRLVVAGEPIGAQEELVEQLTRRASAPDLAGRVEFAGRVEDPRPLLAQSHCLLHAADKEPYGMAMVEALAAGLPVVAPAAGGPTEIYQGAWPPGKSSPVRLYPPGDADAAAAALVAVLADPEPLGRAGRAVAERSHTLAAAQARYRELIDPLR